jgi:HEAT repeat protein
MFTILNRNPGGWKGSVVATQRPNIWKLQASKDVDGLIAALQHRDADIRKRSAAALRVLGSTKAIFALDRAIAREMETDVRDHLVAALEHLDQDNLVDTLVKSKNVAGLIEILYSSRADDIYKAAQALGDLGDRLATEGLVMVFRSPLMPDNVRLAAAEALLKLESAPAVVTLLGALRKDNWRVRHNAAAVLGQLRATWATEPLINTLNDEHTLVKRTAAAALRRFNTPRALQALETYRQKESGTKELSLPLPKTGELRNLPPLPEKPKPAPKLDAVKVSRVPLAFRPPPIGEADDTSATLLERPAGLDEAIQNLAQSRSRHNSTASGNNSRSAMGERPQTDPAE